MNFQFSTFLLLRKSNFLQCDGKAAFIWSESRTEGQLAFSGKNLMQLVFYFSTSRWMVLCVRVCVCVCVFGDARPR